MLDFPSLIPLLNLLKLCMAIPVIDKISLNLINLNTNQHRVWIPNKNKCIVFKAYTWKNYLGNLLERLGMIKIEDSEVLLIYSQ